jgi:uncharacterized lipoprotein
VNQVVFKKVAGTMRIAAVIAVSIVCVTALAGCKSRMQTCSQSDKDYAGAKEMPPLQAPPGLETPDTRNALKVPPLNAPERPRGKDEPCLDAPPPFSPSGAPGSANPAPNPR